MMRLVLTFMVLFLLFDEVYSQVVFGLKGGLNYNDISVNNEPDFYKSDFEGSIGFHLGTYAQIALSEKFYFRPEVQFSQKGAKFGSTRLNLNYLDVPLLLSVRPSKRFSIELGPFFSYQMSAVAKSGRSSAKINDVYDKRIDMGGVGGVCGTLSEKLSLLARYCYGFTVIDEVFVSDANGNVTRIDEYTRTLQLGASYSF